MCFRIGALVAALIVAGCSSESTTSATSYKDKTERLPAEVIGDPASALPKQKARR